MSFYESQSWSSMAVSMNSGISTLGSLYEGSYDLESMLAAPDVGNLALSESWHS